MTEKDAYIKQLEHTTVPPAQAGGTAFDAMTPTKQKNSKNAKKMEKKPFQAGGKYDMIYM